MPPRYAYWTIIAGGLPTAFRAAQKDELQPTFSQIKLKHPDAEMKWFARGRLWDSPESARTANQRAPQTSSQPSGPPRGREWRPGGEHRDPRQKFKDVKQARNAAQRKRKFERRQRFADDGGSGRASRPHGGGQPRFERQPFEKRVQQRSGPRNQSTNEPRPTPPRPDRPNREPRRREGNEPTPPPRPSEPITTPPGPPERGRRRVQERHPRRRR